MTTSECRHQVPEFSAIPAGVVWIAEVQPLRLFANRDTATAVIQTEIAAKMD